MSDLSDKVVVVTGAAEGIGFAIAEAFLQRGARVILLDINETITEKTASLIAKYTGRVVFWKCDVVTDLDVISKRIFEEYKSVDVLVNNAAVLEECNPKKMMEVNVTAVIEWTRKFWEHMRKDKGGKGGLVINMGSIYSYMIDPWLCVYKASKAAVLAFTRSFGDKFHYDRSGVRICAICPGFTRTNFTSNMQTSNEKEVQDVWIKFTKEQLWQEPAAVSKAALYVFERAESGTAWKVEGDLPISLVV